MYLSSQLFLETLYKTLKFQEKLERVRERESKKPERVLEIIFKGSGDLNFKDFLFDASRGGTYRREWTKQPVKKLNLWGKTAVDKRVITLTSLKNVG